MAKVLITGATGLIGSRLTEMLKDSGHTVVHMGRGEKKDTDVPQYTWDVQKGKLDEAAFEGVTTIIHLAGASIADKAWTDERKKEILDSRIKSAGLLHKFLQKGQHSVDTFISASAVGYYGDMGAEVLTEDMPKGDGFLAEVCAKWEDAAINIGKLGIREVSIRIGIVLAKEGGALPELARPVPFGVAPYFAKDNLYYPWVHKDDVCGIMIHAVNNKQMNGAYNATGPKPLLIKDLMQDILTARQSKALLIPTPPIAIKIALGDRQELVLSSQNCSDKKVLATGYQFKYPTALKALQQIYA